MTTAISLPKVSIGQIEMSADHPDPQRAAAIYREYGALVVRGLMRPYIAAINSDVEAAAATARSLYDQAQKVKEGWMTPDRTLWLPAPKGFDRERQIMVLAAGYLQSAAIFMSAMDPRLLDIVEAIHGPNIELFMNGQCLYKEPCGGHPKHLHQDASYFEHKYEGPCAVLNYCVDTNFNNGALHVVPGSHKFGVLKHVDTFSHLGLDPGIWSLEKALPIEGKAGDAIFFHLNTIHGSPENQSAAPRPVFIHRYRRADDYVVVQATGTETRAQAEQRAAAAKKENQLGFMVRGRRTYDASDRNAAGQLSWKD